MNTLPELSAEFLFRWRAGPLRTLNWIRDRLTDTQSDRRFGIRSSPGADVSSRLPSPEYVPYQPVSYVDMDEILAQLAVRETDVFVDLGSGMGRGVCLAATKSFRRVIGVEISPALCAAARRNIEQVRGKVRCQDVTIVEGDARAYAIPGDATVIFLFNPFHGSVLESVLQQIDRSLDAAPRPLTLIFYGTLSANEFRQAVHQHTRLQLEAERVLGTGALALFYRAVH